MYSAVSDQFKQTINAPIREWRVKIDVQLADGTRRTLTGADLEDDPLTVTSACMSKEFELGAAQASDLTIKLINREAQWDNTDFEGATLWPSVGLVLPDKTVEYIPLGVFIVDQPIRPLRTITIKAADRLILLDEPFEKVPVSLPASYRDIVNAIGTHCNVPIAADTLLLDDMGTRAEKIVEGDLSCRDIVAEIALYMGGYVTMTRDGELAIIDLLALYSAAGAGYELTPDNRKSVSFTNEEITLSGLEYNGKIYGGNNSYPLTVKSLALNPTEEALTALGTRLNGVKYTPFKSDTFGDPRIDAGDKVTVTTLDGVTAVTLVGKHVYKYSGGATLSVDGKSRHVSKYKSANARRISMIAAENREYTREQLSTYQQASAQLAEMIGQMLGVYGPTRKESPTGGYIYYFHDKPQLEDSTEIWRFDGQSLAISQDGGETWPTGLTVNSRLIIRTIEAEGIDARWIRLHWTTETLEELLTGINTKVTTNETNINDLGVRVTSTEQSVNEMGDDIERTEGKVTTVEAGLVELRSKVDNDKAALEQQLEDIQVGGRNLVPNAEALGGIDKIVFADSNGENVNVFSQSTATLESDSEAMSGYRVKMNIRASAPPIYGGAFLDIFRANKKRLNNKFTWQFEARKDAATTADVTLVAGSQTNGTLKCPLTTEWQKFKRTWTVNNTVDQHFVFLSDNSTPLGAETVIYVRDLQIEEGTQATTWKPAVEDTDSKIAAHSDDIAQLIEYTETTTLTAHDRAELEWLYRQIGAEVAEITRKLTRWTGSLDDLTNAAGAVQTAIQDILNIADYSLVNYTQFAETYEAYLAQRTRYESIVAEQSYEAYTQLKDAQLQLGERIGVYEEHVRITSNEMSFHRTNEDGELEKQMSLKGDKQTFYVEGNERTWIGSQGLGAQTAVIEERLHACNHEIKKIGTVRSVIRYVGG